MQMPYNTTATETTTRTANAVFSAIQRHNLVPNSISQVDFNIHITWNTGHNRRNAAVLVINEDVVVCFVTGARETFWAVSDTPTAALTLSLEETIEYIRHYIWANHDV